MINIVEVQKESLQDIKDTLGNVEFVKRESVAVGDLCSFIYSFPRSVLEKKKMIVKLKNVHYTGVVTKIHNNGPNSTFTLFNRKTGVTITTLLFSTALKDVIVTKRIHKHTLRADLSFLRNDKVNPRKKYLFDKK